MKIIFHVVGGILGIHAPVFVYYADCCDSGFISVVIWVYSILSVMLHAP